MELLKSLFPVLMSGLGSLGIFGFVLALLGRHDKGNKLKSRLERATIRRERVLDFALQEAVAWGVSLAQVVGPAILENEKGNDASCKAFLGIGLRLVCDQDAAGNWQLKKAPDFMQVAIDKYNRLYGPDPDDDDDQAAPAAPGGN